MLTGGAEGSPPPRFYSVIKAARALNTQPWELRKQHLIWETWANTTDSIDAEYEHEASANRALAKAGRNRARALRNQGGGAYGPGAARLLGRRRGFRTSSSGSGGGSRTGPSNTSAGVAYARPALGGDPVPITKGPLIMPRGGLVLDAAAIMARYGVAEHVFPEPEPEPESASGAEAP